MIHKGMEQTVKREVEEEEWKGKREKRKKKKGRGGHVVVKENCMNDFVN